MNGLKYFEKPSSGSRGEAYVMHIPQNISFKPWEKRKTFREKIGPSELRADAKKEFIHTPCMVKMWVNNKPFFYMMNKLFFYIMRNFSNHRYT